MKFPTYDEFRASQGHQNFAFRESLMNYMAKANGISLDLYVKLIQSCKYFFVKDPVLILHCLHFDGEEWKRCIKESCLDRETETEFVKIDFEKIRSKVDARFLKISSTNPDIASSLVSKLYKGNVSCLELQGQRISFDDLLLFSKNFRILELYKSTVFEENGNEVAYERIVSSFRDLKSFHVIRTNDIYDYTNTVKEMIKIPHFKNIGLFSIVGISALFDMKLFFDFLKKNQKTSAWLSYGNQVLPEEYREMLQSIVDEILEGPRSYLAPFIQFNGQLKRRELEALWKKDVDCELDARIAALS
uniref:Uncharacterized protein n=1 Tax=Panagrolaimus sp. ES5 TaxID=591445 RepID=A0AC34G318_9BILA